jgi:hypothetical protein
VISKLNETNLKKIAKIFSGQYIKLDKYSDINKFLKQIDKIDKKVIENNNSTNQIDTIRLLSFISFIFFMLYLTLYLFEEKIYFLKIKNG